MKELIMIQQGLKAPKNQRNQFGNYNYRSCEDILEAVKPLLEEQACTLRVFDDIVLIGDRFYVKATAVLTNFEGVSESTTAFAREPISKKGMDESQITGMASSYARKYALNGLFCIDDTKDADTMDNTNHPAPKTEKKEDKQEKKVFDSNHPLWQKVLTKMASGVGSIAELQKVYIVPAHVEKVILDYVEKHRTIKQN
jgi:hypothetical protein